MDNHDYRTLFEDFATYCTPDGTMVSAIWSGTRPNANPRALHYWILTPIRSLSQPISEFWQYEVELSGEVIVRYILNVSASDFPSWIKTDIFSVLDDLSLGTIELGVTDLVVDDFTKVEYS